MKKTLSVPVTRRSLLGATLAGAAISAGPRISIAAPLSPNPNDVYVDPQRGADSADGSIHSPLRSLPQAVSMIHSRVAAGATEVRVWLRGGRHELAATLELPVLPSSVRVSWRGYPGETATVSGARALTGWREAEIGGRRAWVAAAPRDDSGVAMFRSLFVNGASRPRPVFPRAMGPVLASHAKLQDLPNTLPRFASGTPSEPQATSFTFTPGTLSATWRNQRDIDIVSFAAFYDERMPLARIGPGSASVRFRPTPGGEGWRDRYYYVDNVGEMLDQPGEWYLDRERGIVTYLPRDGEDLAGTEILLPQVTCLIRIAGTLERPAANYMFEELTFAHCDWDYAPFKRNRQGQVTMHQQGGASVDGAVVLRSCRDIQFGQCHFTALGGFGLEALANCKGVAIRGCSFSDLGGGGIKASSETLGAGNDSYSTSSVSLTDTSVSYFGRVFHLSAGLLFQAVYDCEISHNEVHHGFYTGISCGWSWDLSPSGVRNNLISFNHVHDVGLGLMSDLGGIYTVGRQPGTEIRGNHVHDVSGYAVPHSGIYLDQGSALLTVAGNTVYANSEGIWAPNQSAGVDVFDNVVADNALTQIRAGGGVTGGDLAGVAPYHMKLRRNVVASSSASLIESIDRHVDSDLNLLWKFDGSLSADGVSLVTVEIVEVASGLTVGSAYVPAVGVTTGEWVFQPLEQAVILAPGAEYVIALRAVLGGPAWHQPPLLTTRPVATVLSDTFEWMPGVFSRSGAAQKSFGPVNFRYRDGSASAAFVTATSPMHRLAVRNDVAGRVGMVIKVGEQPVEVTELGAWPLETRGNPLDAWRADGHDGQSLVMDPQFVNRRQHDYTLGDASPARDRLHSGVTPPRQGGRR